MSEKPMSENSVSDSLLSDHLKERSFDEANDRFSLVRAQEGSAILRRYNASIAAVRAGLEKVPARYRETTTAAVQAYMKVAHDIWNQMSECENQFGQGRRLQMDAQMHFAQSTKLLMAQTENPAGLRPAGLRPAGILGRLFQRKSIQAAASAASADARDLAVESATAVRSAVDQQTDALLKHHVLQGEFERTLNEMAQIVQQHMVHGREAKTVDDPLLSISSGNGSGKAKQTRQSDVPPVH